MKCIICTYLHTYVSVLTTCTINKIDWLCAVRLKVLVKYAYRFQYNWHDYDFLFVTCLFLCISLDGVKIKILQH